MAVFQDGAGLTYTAASQEAVDKYAHMIRGYLGMTRDVGDRLKDVLAADGEMPMAVAAKGYFFLLFATGAMTARPSSLPVSTRDASTISASNACLANSSPCRT